MKNFVIFLTVAGSIFTIGFLAGVRVTDNISGKSAETFSGLSDLPVSPLDIKKTAQKERVPDSKDLEAVDQNKVVSISFVGDCTLGTDPRFGGGNTFVDKYNQVQDYGYFFSNVVDIFSESDLVMANLEGTFTESSKRADKKFTFKGPPSYAKILTQAGIGIVNLANNHTMDFGKDGYKDTLAALDAEGIKYVDKDLPQIMELEGVKFGFCGFNGFSNDTSTKKLVKDTITKLKDDGAQFVIISFHWGAEYQYKPNVVQKNLARHAIDNGADLVVGHHPHVLQPIENYNGRNIAYSLGNFSFGGNSNPSDKDTVIFMQTFNVSPNSFAELGEYKVTPCLLSSVKERNDYRPTPAQGDDVKRILGKLGV